MTLTAANVKVDLGPAHITAGARHDPDELRRRLTARLTGTLTFDLPRLRASGRHRPRRHLDGDPTCQPAYIRVDGKNVKLKIGGQELTGDFSFERATARRRHGRHRDRRRATSATASARPAAGATLTNGHGALSLTAAGLAGSCRARSASRSRATRVFTGTFALPSTPPTPRSTRR